MEKKEKYMPALRGSGQKKHGCTARAHTCMHATHTHTLHLHIKKQKNHIRDPN